MWEDLGLDDVFRESDTAAGAIDTTEVAEEPQLLSGDEATQETLAETEAESESMVETSTQQEGEALDEVASETETDLGHAGSELDEAES